MADKCIESVPKEIPIDDKPTFNTLESGCKPEARIGHIKVGSTVDAAVSLLQEQGDQALLRINAGLTNVLQSDQSTFVNRFSEEVRKKGLPYNVYLNSMSGELEIARTAQ